MNQTSMWTQREYRRRQLRASQMLPGMPTTMNKALRVALLVAIVVSGIILLHDVFNFLCNKLLEVDNPLGRPKQLSSLYVRYSTRHKNAAFIDLPNDKGNIYLALEKVKSETPLCSSIDFVAGWSDANIPKLHTDDKESLKKGVFYTLASQHTSSVPHPLPRSKCFSNRLIGYQDARIVGSTNGHYHVFLNDYTVGLEAVRLFYTQFRVPDFLVNEYKSNEKDSFTKIMNEPVKLEFRNGGQRRKIEKNWIPFIYKKDLYALYSLDPYIIVKIPILQFETHSRPSKLLVETMYNLGSCVHLKRLKGGTNAVSIDFLGGDFLAIGHYYLSPIVLPTAAFRRYRHVAYTFSAHPPFRVNRISDEFTFTNYSAGEFATTLSRRGTNLVVSLGIGDVHSIQTMFPLDSIVSTLKMKQC
eukprot:m.167594 g.167594  ORF g.167594 m.167594 type:complete len:414 (+) comp15307_c0_seq2:163-1404(+)